MQLVNVLLITFLFVCLFLKKFSPTLHFRDSYGLITQFRFDLPRSRLSLY